MTEQKRSTEQSPVTRAKYLVKFIADRLEKVKSFEAFKNLTAADVMDNGLFDELKAVSKLFGDSVRVPLEIKLQNLISERATHLATAPVKDGKLAPSEKWEAEYSRLSAEIALTERAIETKKEREAAKAAEAEAESDEEEESESASA